MRKSFILYLDSLEVLDDLTIEQKAMLFDAIRNFNLGKEVQLSGLMKAIFTPFKNQFERDDLKYVQKLADKSHAGFLGNLKKWHSDLYDQYRDGDISIEEAISRYNARKTSQSIANIADAINASQSIANIAVNVNDTVNDKVNDINNTLVNENSFVSEKSETPNLLEEKGISIISKDPPQASHGTVTYNALNIDDYQKFEEDYEIAFDMALEFLKGLDEKEREFIKKKIGLTDPYVYRMHNGRYQSFTLMVYQGYIIPQGYHHHLRAFPTLDEKKLWRKLTEFLALKIVSEEYKSYMNVNTFIGHFGNWLKHNHDK